MELGLRCVASLAVEVAVTVEVAVAVENSVSVPVAVEVAARPLPSPVAVAARPLPCLSVAVWSFLSSQGIGYPLLRKVSARYLWGLACAGYGVGESRANFPPRSRPTSRCCASPWADLCPRTVGCNPWSLETSMEEQSHSCLKL